MTDNPYQPTVYVKTPKPPKGNSGVSSPRTTRVERSDVRKLLGGLGLTDNPAEYGDGIHSWRCEHPDRYGRCDCFEDAVSSVMKLIGEE